MRARNKQLTIAVILALLIAAVFWSQSRIPALNEKAQMGLRTNFGDIAFEILLPVTAEQHPVVRVLRSAVNWAYTNLYGMTFGLLFAAAVLTILANLQHRQFRSPWLNSLSGILVGAPLGVCVNCATPIALGLYSAGARLETALASLIASPTLNAIVLTMAFSLLPFELALAKLAGVALTLLLLPFLVRRFSTGADIDSVNAVAAKGSPRLPPIRSTAVEDDAELTFAGALLNCARQFATSLWYLVRYAVPLMALAGLLGAVAIELIPFERFAGSGATPGHLILASTLAMLLPVPIAFDVIVSKALLEGGVNIGLVSAFLFGLGIYSIYPAVMIARYISLRLSIAIGTSVVLIAIAMGFSADTYFANLQQAERQVIEKGLVESDIELYRRAASVCSTLPARLKTTCFVQHIDDFDELVSQDTLCRGRPNNIDSVQCKALVTAHEVSQEANQNADPDACSSLPDPTARARCAIGATMRLAQRFHDINRCDRLQRDEFIVACRQNFLNARLLFNPDDTACSGLPVDEQQLCEINAAVYRYAEALDFDGCESLADDGARDHCRYTIASSMIGLHNDASGCDRIQSQPMAARCRSLTVAWSAAREQRGDLCNELPDQDLQDTCLLRVADRQIHTVLAEIVLRADSEVRVDATVATITESTRHDPPTLEWRTLTTDADARVAFTPFADKAPSTQSASAFRSVSASKAGITHFWKFRVTDFFEPFIVGKGIASGDFNADAWPDLVFATERGIQLYRNVGGKFERVQTDQGVLRDANLFLVALVDADNDGQQDIFASAYGGHNYLLYNLDGQFTRTRLQTFSGPQRLTMSAGFGDLNLDGELDIVIGNWSSGVEKLFVPEQSENALWLRNGSRYDVHSFGDFLGEIKGETNTLLVADINGDSYTDLLIGNDRLVPDFYYLGNGNADFAPITVTSNTVPTTSMFTMSLDAADFNNDLEADLFATDMTFAQSSRNEYCQAIDDQGARDLCESRLRTYTYLQTESASRCSDYDDAADVRECFVAFATKSAKDLKDSRYCDKLPGTEVAARSLCDYLAAPVPPDTQIDLREHLPQTQRNMLLMSTGSGFVETAETFGVAASYWSWNAKAADLDNDGWQDIYVGNGFHFGDSFYEIQENVMFRNLQGQGFAEVQESWALNDPLNTPSYAYADIDLDGDVDIVATGVIAPPRIFINELNAGNSVTIVLDDEIGHSQGIGSKVRIEYGGPKALKQQQENTLSSGFLSFDNPVLQFGLGADERVDRIVVLWSDKAETTIEGPLPANGIYRIERPKKTNNY